MKLLVIDSNNGAKTLINSIKTIKLIDYKLVKLPNSELISVTKNSLRELTLKLLTNNLAHKYDKYDVCIIMCISASSSTLDILIKNNFIIANVVIIEPLIPTCLYIKEHKFKTLLILSTQITQKIRWISRLLNSSAFNINYASLNLSENKMTNNTKISEAINKLIKYKSFIANCDCIVLGCSSYSIIKNIIAKELKSKYNFNGLLLDSSIITFNYFSNHFL